MSRLHWVAILISLALSTLGNVFAQESREFLISYTKNGRQVQEVMDLNDTLLLPKLRAIAQQSPYKIEVISDSIKDIYDERGNLKVKRIEGYRRLSGQAYEVYTYDDNNRLIRKASFDVQGELKEGPFGIAVHAYTYDALGNLIEKRSFDERERPARLEDTGPAITRYDYDEQNRLIRITYMDERGQLLRDRLAMERFVYDAEGNQVEKIQMNRDGRELNRLRLR